MAMTAQTRPAQPLRSANPGVRRGVGAAPVNMVGTVAESRALLVITFLCLISPFSFSIGSLFMSPSRLLFLFTVPFLAVRLLSGAYGRLIFTDYAVGFHVFWVMVAIVVNHPEKAATFAGSTALNICGGYLTARATIRSAQGLRFFGILFAVTVVLMLPLALSEALTENIVVTTWLEDILPPGLYVVRDIDYCCRFGLDRAQVFFVHPIHFGMFASGAIGIYFGATYLTTSPFTRSIVVFMMATTTFFSVSSGPFLTALFQIALLGYLVIFHSFRWQWKALIWSTAGIYAVLEVLSDRAAIFAIASRLAFNPGTAYFRRELFEIGTAQIARTPIFGIGLHRPSGMHHWMPSTLDNFWLAQAVSWGYPGFLSISAAVLYSMIRVGRGKLIKGSELYYCRAGWTILWVSLLLTLSTVTVWNQLHSVIFMLLGAGQFLLLIKEPEENTAPPEEAPVATRRRYTRFPVAYPARSAVTPRLKGT